MTGGDRALISSLEGLEDLQLIGQIQLEDHNIKRQCGEITLRSDGKFNIGFCPDPSMGEPVRAVGLPMSELPRAIDDMLAAGFH